MLRRSTFSVSISDLLFVLLCLILGNDDEDGYEAEILRIRMMMKMIEGDVPNKDEDDDDQPDSSPCHCSLVDV